jgi:hypothetical protein
MEQFLSEVYSEMKEAAKAEEYLYKAYKHYKECLCR